MKRGVFCFRNDLRLDDNPALNQAFSECDEIIFAYIFEDRIWKSTSPVRINRHRAEFLLESLHSLKDQINRMGGSLIFLEGVIEDVIPAFMKQHQISECFISEEDAWEEKQSEIKLRDCIAISKFNGSTLIDPSDLPFNLSDLPDTFSKFRKIVEKNLKIRTVISKKPPKLFYSENSSNVPSIESIFPSLEEKDHRSEFHFHGGVSSGRQRIREWIWESHSLSRYKLTRNELTGPDFSSRFSPWLSAGCLSPRTIFFEIKNYETKFGANESTYWLFFELLWRDYFHFLARKHGPRLFHPLGFHPERMQTQLPEDQITRFESWKKGCTQNDFVNANMNELRATGWMSNRGRQNVASYLIHNLGVHWLLGAQWFEECLIDYDPCSNYGNWLYLSGFGSDPRPNRKFNVIKQADTYDPTGFYRRKWSRQA